MGHGGGEERQVHPPWPLHDQDPPEAGDQGWQEGGLREGDDGEGEACEDDRQGLPGVGLEEEHLSWIFRHACVDIPQMSLCRFVSGPVGQWTLFQMYFSHLRLAK